MKSINAIKALMTKQSLCILFLMAIVMTGCHTKKTAIQSSPPITAITDDDGPYILFLTGTIAYDSVAAVYSITIDSQQRFSGQMNTEGAACTGKPRGLYYQQEDAKGEILSQHEIDNPLELRVEYFNGSQPQTKTIKRDKAELFVRLQLNPKTRHITFMYDSLKIQTINIKKQFTI